MFSPACSVLFFPVLQVAERKVSTEVSNKDAFLSGGTKILPELEERCDWQ